MPTPSLPAGVRLPIPAVFPLAAILMLAPAPQPARAQTIGVRTGGNDGRSVELGRINFYPSVLVDYGYLSNVFYASGETAGDEIVPSRLLVLQSRFSFDLPMGDNWLRWSYSPIYRNYSSDAFTQTDPWSHFFDLDGRLRFGARGFTALKDHFVLGTQELREVDPGGELTFGLTRFRLHQPSVEVGMVVGPRQSVSVIWKYDSTQFDQSQTIGAYNNRGWGLEGRFTYKIGTATDTYIYYSGYQSTQDRGGSPPDLVDIHDTAMGVGLSQSLNRDIVTQFLVGYQRMDFTGAAPTGYAGPILSANASWRIDEITQLAFIVRRQPYASYYLNNNFYLNRNITLNLTRQAGATMYWTVGLGLENNVYSDTIDAGADSAIFCGDDGSGGTICPSDGERRRDRGWNAQAGLGFKIGPASRVVLGYNYSARSSNVLQAFPEGFADPFNYSASRILFRIEAGWL
jgi:hypothetical protein